MIFLMGWYRLLLGCHSHFLLQQAIKNVFVGFVYLKV
jgi:hypothetical protein